MVSLAAYRLGIPRPVSNEIEENIIKEEDGL